MAVVVVVVGTGARIAKCGLAWAMGCGLIKRHCRLACSLNTGRERWRWTQEGGVENRGIDLREKRGRGCSMQGKDSLGPLEEDAVVLNL